MSLAVIETASNVTFPVIGAWGENNKNVAKIDPLKWKKGSRDVASLRYINPAAVF